MRFLTIVFLGLVVVSALPAQDENQSTAEYAVVTNVQYCTGGGKPLLMDVFIPRKRIYQPTSAVLWLHGGGWERGEDCKCAIRYLRTNAKQYEIDPNRIGIAGASSGGHLAMLAGTADEKAGLEGSGGWPGVSSRVKAVVSYYGPADFRAMTTDFGDRAKAAITKLLGVSFQGHPDAYARASPVTYISPDDPPLLMVHGDGDTLVPFSQSERMLQAYVRAGLKADLVKVGNANHDFEPVSNEPLSISVERVHDLTIEFFKKYL